MNCVDVWQIIEVTGDGDDDGDDNDSDDDELAWPGLWELRSFSSYLTSEGLATFPPTGR